MNKKENKISKDIKINKKSARRNYSNQTGITLIALVVTIVVLLILAGVSINTLFRDNGIIKKAQDAQNRMNNAQESDLNALNELDEFIDDATGKLPSTEDTTPYYPDGTFSKVSRTNLSNGLVIQDAKENEYVWIEVPKSLYENSSYNTKTKTADQKPENSEDYGKIEYCLHKYTETYRNGTSSSDTYYSDEMTGLTKIKYNELKQKMLKSVYENGGFWIGRYEAGIETNRTSSRTAITVAPLSKQGTVENPVYPYTYVTCSQAQTLASQLSTDKSYTSSLMFGVQWDLVLKHIEVKAVEQGTELATIQSELRSDSTSWGNCINASFVINRGKYAKYGALATWYNYNTALKNSVTYENGISTKVSASSISNSILLTTGASDACKKMNIYDLAGNVLEWTLEYTPTANYPCVYRGGYYYGNGSNSPASSRGSGSYGMANSVNHIGFRPSLFK